MATKKNNIDNQDNTSSTVVKSQAASYDIAKSDETLDLAKDLAKFIKENKLSTQVQGKEFVNVEGWQYAGSRLGIVPIVEHVINVSSDQEIKYQAKVTLFDLRHATTVGAGFAICSNKESGRKFYQEYAIASMAQTRAVGKAYRNILAWIIRAAGYEPTPAEEMEYSGNVPAPVMVVAEEPKKLVAEASAPVSVPPAASTTSDEKVDKLVKAVMAGDTVSVLTHQDGSQELVAGPSIAGPTNIPAEVLAKFARQFEAVTSGVDLKKLWDSLTKNEATALFAEKEAAKRRLAAAAKDAVTGMRVAGSESGLVDEFADELVTPNVPVVDYATGEQKECIQRLLNHPLITRKEKTKMLLNINRLDCNRARLAIIKLRTAIADREGVDPREGARASVKAFVQRNLIALSDKQVDDLNALAANPDATLEFLLDTLGLAQAALLDDQTYGTDAELEELEAGIAA